MGNAGHSQAVCAIAEVAAVDCSAIEIFDVSESKIAEHLSEHGGFEEELERFACSGDASRQSIESGSLLRPG